MFLVRNYTVYIERMRIITVIFTRKASIDDYEYYLALKNTVSYHEMVWFFWIWPLDRFWPKELRELKND
jgi:hypothetical protein